MRGAYLLCLLAAGAAVALLDRRWRLALWHPRGRARTVAVGLAGAALLLVWDVVAIDAGFYGRGDSAALLGVWLAPHLPLEEVVFVVFFAYVTLVVAGAADRLVAAASSRAGHGDDEADDAPPDDAPLDDTPLDETPRPSRRAVLS
ncbi:lycopene cyclase domain-containing protein [Cellulomonas palmilytica]|uniref:lycopene cyclase domain-containing protein n=1 Tax=Cellulomonas palmilytica TaxID=2608402 RepID=UPI001F3852B4|nr:lycopene cyclase domain-containing protein [Cellulomonas palmilytica]UJP39132.1 lycopene cyclase domain-containing protein [Cellulomonas palmilytica]